MGRKVVLTFSFIVAAFAFAAAVLFHRSLTPIPIWDKVAMTYGGVFCVFWFFDTAGKKVSKKFASDDEEPARPTPRPSSNQRKRAVLPGESRYLDTRQASDSAASLQTSDTDLKTGRVDDLRAVSESQGTNDPLSLSLERVRNTQKILWQNMLDNFAREVLALDGLEPETDEDGHVTGWRADEFLSKNGIYSFWIQRNEEKIGTLVASLVKTATAGSDDDSDGDMDGDVNVEIQVVFVTSAWRRQGIARASLEKLTEFLLLLHENCRLHCEISYNNHRARRYLEDCGFEMDGQNAADAESEIKFDDGVKDGVNHSDTTYREHWLRVIS